MGRLIREEDVINLLVARYEGEEYIRNDVRNIPTAFDVEAVVKEMQKSAFSDLTEEYVDNGEAILFLAEAIDIVRKGGMK